MPTVFSHAVAATAAAQWWRRPLPAGFWTWTVVGALLPDIDVIGFSFGIRYDDLFGHRGFTHSFLFAAMFGALAAWRLPQRSHRPESDLHQPREACLHQSAPALHQPRSNSGRLALFLWFTAVTASHGLLDAFTNGGRGIAFFAPFSNHRYFFPWRPIQVSPIGVGFFSARGLRVLASESVWIWVPSAIIAVSARVVRRR